MEFNGKRLTPGQANNCFAFPALVLATMTVLATRMPDEIFLLAAHELAEFPTNEEMQSGRIYPLVKQANEVAYKIGVKVAKYLIENGESLHLHICANYYLSNWLIKVMLSAI